MLGRTTAAGKHGNKCMHSLLAMYSCEWTAYLSMSGMTSGANDGETAAALPSSTRARTALARMPAVSPSLTILLLSKTSSCNEAGAWDDGWHGDQTPSQQGIAIRISVKQNVLTGPRRWQQVKLASGLKLYKPRLHCCRPLLGGRLACWIVLGIHFLVGPGRCELFVASFQHPGQTL